MASSPFKNKPDIKRLNGDARYRAYYELGIPSLYWESLLDRSKIPKLTEISTLLKSLNGRIVICSKPTEDPALIHIFSTLTALLSEVSGCAVSVDQLQIWNDQGRDMFSCDADWLAVYPVSSKITGRNIQAIRNFWFKYNMLVSFCGTPKEWTEIMHIKPALIIDLTKDVSY